MVGPSPPACGSNLPAAVPASGCHDIQPTVEMKLLRERLRELREGQLGQSPLSYADARARSTTEKVRAACSSYKTTTALGVDDLSLVLIALLPDEALDELGDLLAHMLLDIAIPIQSWASEIVLLVKKTR